MDMAASPMRDTCLRVASDNLVTAQPIDMIGDADCHHTDEACRIDREDIGRLLGERSIILLLPLGYSSAEEILNLTCRDVTVRAAIGLETEKLILYDVEQGLLDISGKPVRELRPQQVPTRLQWLGNSY